MGLFGGSKTYVASTLYNLAGDELENRMSFLKTAVISSIVMPRPPGQSGPDSIREAYLGGPGMKMRSFFRWALDNYDPIGVPTGTLGGTGQIDLAVVTGEIPVTAGTTADVQQAIFDQGDYSFWAEQWMLENHPALIDTAWTSDISAAGTITINYEGGGSDTFTPVDFDPQSIYLYVLYVEVTPGDPPVTSGQMMWIYKFGSGNAELDALVTESSSDGEYFPFIPIRLNNEFIDTLYPDDFYPLAKRATKKVGAGRLDDLIEKLADNESLPDIDFAYIMFGVPLNVLDPSSRKYLWNFFEKLRLANTDSNAEYLLWLDGGGVGLPPTNNVRIQTVADLQSNVNMTITWKSIALTNSTGLGKPDAKENEIWLVQGIADDTFHIHRQNDGSYDTLTVIGAKHDNLIYNNKSVVTTSKEALEDADPSGFLVPLHYATLREMTLVDATQMCSACSYLVLNSYKIVKQKWYETTIFKIFVFVAIIAITVVTAGTGGAGAIGLLGSAASVGGAIGLTGTLAIIAGTIINTLAAMLLMKLIMLGSVELFGEKLGALIGTIVGVIALQVGTGVMNGFSLSTSWGNMMSAQNLLGLTNAVLGGITAYVQGSAMETYQKMEESRKAYEKQTRELNEKFVSEFGYGKAVLDPMSMVDALVSSAGESSSTFLGRTLMTGTDIAEMSKDMLTNFAHYTLTLKSAG